MPAFVRASLSRRFLVGSGAFLIWIGSVVGCASRPIPPPYAPSEAPQTDLLLQAVPARAKALQVPRAKIREGALSANMLLAAQTPNRFSGTVTLAGNELLSLAVNEHEYGLRVLGDRGLAQGYYAGPPSACAVERLLGIPWTPTQLTTFLLGGAPLVIAPTRWPALTDEGRPGWDRKLGRERLVIADSRYIQELRFAFVEQRWVFAGTSVWQRSGERATFLFAADHVEFRSSSAGPIASRTILRRPGERKIVELEIRYLERIVDPPALLASGGDAGSEDGGDDGWGEDEGWDDDGDEESPAPSEDTGDTADVDDPADSSDPRDAGQGGAISGTAAGDSAMPSVDGQPARASASTSTPTTAGATVSNDKPKPASAIPRVFVPSGTGLAPRGDVCR